MRELLTELHRHRETVLIRIPDVVRALLPHGSIDVVHDALLTLFKDGTIELRPDAGTEFSRPEDVALCPRGPRDSVFMFARWTDANAR
jgi:hypothetical protein